MCKTKRHNPQFVGCTSAGFTIIELILVIVIMALVSTIAMPAFVKSIRGARLRQSSRTVVMAHRYARSLAVLHQKHVGLLFDTEAQRVEVAASTSSGVTSPQMGFIDTYTPESEDEFVEEETSSQWESELIRPMADGVRIVNFQGDEVWSQDGIYYVEYQPNGMCQKYELQLVDEKEKKVTIKINPLSGKVKVVD